MLNIIMFWERPGFTNRNRVINEAIVYGGFALYSLELLKTALLRLRENSRRHGITGKALFKPLGECTSVFYFCESAPGQHVEHAVT